MPRIAEIMPLHVVLNQLNSSAHALLQHTSRLHKHVLPNTVWLWQTVCTQSLCLLAARCKLVIKATTPQDVRCRHCHRHSTQHHCNITHLQELNMVHLPNTVGKTWASKSASATNCACTVHSQLILNALKHTCRATPLLLATTSIGCACSCSCLWHQLQEVLPG
jgi:hypothetical protein